MPSLESLVRDNVKSNSFLFDKAHPDYVDTKLKRETWERIAHLIGEQEGIELNGGFIESLWRDMKGKYKKMISALKNHDSGRNKAPEGVDYNFIDAMKFAHDVLENRPVQSSFSRPGYSKNEEHPIEFASQRMLLRNQLRYERQDATVTIWGSPAQEQSKVGFYDSELPPTVPPSDAFAVAKQAHKRELLDSLNKKHAAILQEMRKMNGKNNAVCSSIFFNPLMNVLGKIDNSLKEVFYEDVKEIIKAHKK